MTFEDLPNAVEQLLEKINGLATAVEAVMNREQEMEDEKIKFTQALDVVKCSAPTLRKMTRETDIPVHFDTGTGRPYFFRRELMEWMRTPGQTQFELTKTTLRRLDRKRAEAL